MRPARNRRTAPFWRIFVLTPVRTLRTDRDALARKDIESFKTHARASTWTSAQRAHTDAPTFARILLELTNASVPTICPWTIPEETAFLPMRVEPRVAVRFAKRIVIPIDAPVEKDTSCRRTRELVGISMNVSMAHTNVVTIAGISRAPTYVPVRQNFSSEKIIAHVSRKTNAQSRRKAIVAFVSRDTVIRKGSVLA